VAVDEYVKKIREESFYKYLKAEPVKLNEYQQKAYLFKIAYRLIIDQVRKTKVPFPHYPTTLSPQSNTSPLQYPITPLTHHSNIPKFPHYTITPFHLSKIADPVQ
jgi:hypothetical protein